MFAEAETVVLMLRDEAAVDALVRNLAVALGPSVRVNGIAPGIVLPPEDVPPEEVARLVARTPLGRTVAVADLVSAAFFSRIRC